MAEPVLHAPVHEHTDLIPVRMCNELVYCPRLFHLEHVQGVFIESADTIEGTAQHERAVRRGRRRRVEPVADDASSEADPLEGVPKSLTLHSQAWGVTGKIDLVEVSAERIVAVEAKRGRAPERDEHTWGDHILRHRIWPADLVQIGLYMALLREVGLACEEGHVLYRGSGDREVVVWTDDLELFLRDAVREARRVAGLQTPPEPLVDSPKCPGCSLHEACLPDEHLALVAERDAQRGPVRRIVPGRDDRAVVHVVTPGTTVHKDGDSLKIATRTSETQRIPLKDVAHLALMGPVHITQRCVQHLLRSGIPISHHTGGGRLLGLTAPLGTRNVVIRRAQYRAAEDPSRCLDASRAFVIAKIRNQRTVLKRYRRGLTQTVEAEEGTALPEWAGGGGPQAAAASVDARAATTSSLRRMQVALRAAERAKTIEALRGHEGDAAAQYFAALPGILPHEWKHDFAGRTRRPPRDRVNAMLSFAYALLVRDATAAVARIGLDPMLGLFHTMIPGRPALALDVMEPFRAAWADTAMLRLIATGGIERSDFHLSAAGVMLSDKGRRAVIRAYERRADELTTHPRFGYRMSYRRLLELEARILAKWLVGEIDELRPLWTR